MALGRAVAGAWVGRKGSIRQLSAHGTKDTTSGTHGAFAHLSTMPIALIQLVLNRYLAQGVSKGVH